MIWPDVHDERMMELRSRGLPAAPRVAWRSNGLFVSLLFFVLTSVGILATYLFFQLGVSEVAWLTTVICVALAEYLIRTHRFFGTGVESALWLGGMLLLIPELPGKASNAALLLFAAAAALAGFRVRNALFGALAAVFTISYFIAEGENVTAAWTGVAISLVAIAALLREWQRPSTERLWTALAIIPPMASCFAAIEWLSLTWMLMYAAIAAGCVIAGLIARNHALLITSGVYAVLASSMAVAWDFLPYPREWSMILTGAMLLAASAIVARELRAKTRGVVVKPDALTGFDEELQIVGTIAAQPAAGTPAAPEGGGRFGGAGATGDY